MLVVVGERPARVYDPSGVSRTSVLRISHVLLEIKLADDRSTLCDPVPVVTVAVSPVMSIDLVGWVTRRRCNPTGRIVDRLSGILVVSRRLCISLAWGGVESFNLDQFRVEWLVSTVRGGN